MKKCIKCLKEKPIGSFYKHPHMSDGRDSKCSDCVKKYVKERNKQNSSDPLYVMAERKRGRDKYKRLYAGRTNKKKKSDVNAIQKKYRAKYPEKMAAHSATSNIYRAKGIHLHHWSYNKEHFKDVIELSNEDHSKLHRYMLYDQERKMYRNLFGALLDSRESHIAYFEMLKNWD